MAQIRLTEGDTIVLGDYEISYNSLIGLIARLSNERVNLPSSTKRYVKPTIKDFGVVNIGKASAKTAPPAKPKPHKPNMFLSIKKDVKKTEFAKAVQNLYLKYYGVKKSLKEIKGTKKSSDEGKENDRRKQHIVSVKFKQKGQRAKAAYLYVVRGKSKDLYDESEFSRKEGKIYLGFAES